VRLYPLHVVLHPLGRVAVSHRVRDRPAAGSNGEDAYTVRQVDLDALDHVIGTFPYRTVEDSDLIDGHADDYLSSQAQLSLDLRWPEHRSHVLGLWLDDAPRQLLDIGLWFERLYLLDAALNPVSLELLALWRRNFRAHPAGGTGAMSQLNQHGLPSPSEVLARIGAEECS
jgi:hypothetical protein